MRTIGKAQIITTAPDRYRLTARMRLVVILASIAAGLFLVTLAVGVATLPATQPAPAPRAVPCAAEDACSIDYHDGAWHIGAEYAPDAPANQE